MFASDDDQSAAKQCVRELESMLDEFSPYSSEHFDAHACNP
jgi:hypothetical protein